MFQPAPQRVGFELTAYVFFDFSSMRCCRNRGSVGISPQSTGALSASSLIRSPGSADTASAPIMPSTWGFAYPDKLFPLPLCGSEASIADDPVEPLPLAPPVLASSTSIFPSLSAWGPEESSVTLETVMPAPAQDLVM